MNRQRKGMIYAAVAVGLCSIWGLILHQSPTRCFDIRRPARSKPLASPSLPAAYRLSLGSSIGVDTSRAPCPRDTVETRSSLGSILVQARTIEGNPVESAQIVLKRGICELASTDLDRTRTEHHFRHLPSGTYSIEILPASLPGGWHVLSPQAGLLRKKTIGLKPGEVSEITFVCAQGATLQGQTYDALGIPLAGAFVRLQALDPTTGASHILKRCEPNGVFEFRDVLPGRYRLQTTRPKLLTDDQSVVGAMPAPRVLELLPSGYHKIEVFANHRGHSLAGRLVNPDGHPASGVTVRCALDAAPNSAQGQGSRLSRSLEFARVLSDSQGRFLLQSIPSEPITLHAAPPGSTAIGFRSPKPRFLPTPLGRFDLRSANTTETIDLGTTICRTTARNAR